MAVATRKNAVCVLLELGINLNPRCHANGGAFGSSREVIIIITSQAFSHALVLQLDFFQLLEVEGYFLWIDAENPIRISDLIADRCGLPAQSII